jgi:hypothetical protein
MARIWPPPAAAPNSVPSNTPVRRSGTRQSLRHGNGNVEIASNLSIVTTGRAWFLQLPRPVAARATQEEVHHARLLRHLSRTATLRTSAFALTRRAGPWHVSHPCCGPRPGIRSRVPDLILGGIFSWTFWPSGVSITFSTPVSASARLIDSCTGCTSVSLLQFNQTIMLADALRRRNVPVERLIFPDEVHDFLLHRTWLAAYEAPARFLMRI